MRRAIVTFGALWATAVACDPATPLAPPPKTPTPVASASVSVAPSTSTSASAKPAPVDPLVALKARGTVVAGPFPLAGYAGHKAVAFLGDNGIAQVAWFLDDKDTWSPVRGFPTAVKVREVFVAKGQPYAVVESVAALDQPAGLVGTIPIRDETFSIFSDTEDLYNLRGATTKDAIEAWLSQKGAPEPKDLEAEQKKLFASASKSVEALGKHLQKGGVDVLEHYQGAFVRTVEHVDEKGFAKNARAKQMLEVVHALDKESSCLGSTCLAGGTSVVLSRDGKGGALRIAAFFELGAPPVAAPKKVKEKKPKKGKHAPKSAAVVPAPVPKSKPLPVAARADTSVTAAVALRLLSPKAKVVAEAPLRGEVGAIGVVTVDGDSIAWLVITDGAYARAIPVWAMSCCGDGPYAYEVKFVDANGDGTTDLMLRRTGPDSEGKPSTYTLLFDAPRTINQWDLGPDQRFTLALFRAPTLDAGLAAVIAHEDPKITVAEACALVSTFTTLKGWRASTTKDAVLLNFNEPFMPTLSPTLNVPADKVTKEQLRKPSCAGMSCFGGACITEVEGPGSTNLWFRREGKALKLVGMAEYTGS